MKFPFACCFLLLMDVLGSVYTFCLHKITMLYTKGADGTAGLRSGRIASHVNGASRAFLVLDVKELESNCGVGCSNSV